MSSVHYDLFTICGLAWVTFYADFVGIKNNETENYFVVSQTLLKFSLKFKRK